MFKPRVGYRGPQLEFKAAGSLSVWAFRKCEFVISSSLVVFSLAAGVLTRKTSGFSCQVVIKRSGGGCLLGSLSLLSRLA